jgi:hypothetical protein
MAKLYGIGAAVVIVGALFKIQHWPLADFFLIIGLSTEAIIFFFSAFEPPHEDPDWSLVYPELATGEHAEGDDFKKEDQRSITEQLDDMLEGAKIEPELIESLGDGMRSLSDQAKQMGEITGAAAATSEYAEKPEGCQRQGEHPERQLRQGQRKPRGPHRERGRRPQRRRKPQPHEQEPQRPQRDVRMQLRSSREKLEAANQMFEGMGEMLTHLQEQRGRHQALQGEHRRTERQPGQAQHGVRQHAGRHDRRG